MRSITPGLTNRILYAIIALLPLQTAMAQSVGIGTTSPEPSARLEVNSTNQGILIPRLTAAQRSAISNPATGLLVFQTDGIPGFYYYTGANWMGLANGIQPNSAGVSFNYGLTTTVAGNGTIGDMDGTGAAATFSGPAGLAIDASGNIYVADIANSRIRKVIPQPGGTVVVTTFAGETRGDQDGTGTAARFDFPSGVAVDVSGNVYVADRDNDKIRKIAPNGVVTTVAGSGSPGFADDTGAAAYFNAPAGIAVDLSGNIYVADRYNHRIRKITSTGVVTTVAGNGSTIFADGTGGAATFHDPYGVAVDASGNIYVADFLNHRIRKITPTGEVTTLAGNGTRGRADGIGAAASFDSPIGVAVDALGNVYVSEYANNNIRKISAAGVVSTLAGSSSTGFADGVGNAATFNRPFGIAVDATGNVYIGDLNNERIRKIIAQ